MGDTGRTRRAVIGGLGAAAAGAVPLAAMAQGTPTTGDPQVRVVFHVAQPDHWPYALSNLDNLTVAAPDGSFQVVVDGTAVYTMDGENDLLGRMAKLAEGGVTFHVCPNALKEHGIPVEQAPAWAKTDLGGVLALVDAHRNGYVYVKP
jgi:uncharacterized protein